jgi:GTP-binding protein
LPADAGAEVAFAGRSNSGKSSAINALCGQHGLARTSRTPGRTQHLVVFELDPARRLVDLPGFGYAKVSKQMRAHWEQTLPRYLEARQALRGVVLLMDVRHPLKPQDEAMVAWCAATAVPLHVLVNKCDKLGRGPAAAAVLLVRRYLAAQGAIGTAQTFSALRRDGLEQAYAQLADWFGLCEA